MVFVVLKQQGTLISIDLNCMVQYVIYIMLIVFVFLLSTPPTK